MTFPSPVFTGAGHAITEVQHQHKWKAAQATMVVEDTECVVVGAGQAGLCTSYHLTQKGVSDHLVIDRASKVGSSWRHGRWDSFRLVTENSLCRLPDFSVEEIGEDPRGFMPREKIVEYLQGFQRKHGIAVRFNTGLKEVTRAWGNKWIVETEPEPEHGDGGVTGGSCRWIRANAVVMASGGFDVPKLPPFATDGLAALGVQVIHSSQYKNPKDSIKAGAGTGVLVVGTGQSGTQIAADIAEAGDHHVYAAVSSRSLRMPRKVRGKDCTVWLNEMGDYDKQ